MWAAVPDVQHRAVSPPRRHRSLARSGTRAEHNVESGARRRRTRPPRVAADPPSGAAPRRATRLAAREGRARGSARPGAGPRSRLPAARPGRVWRRPRPRAVHKGAAAAGGGSAASRCRCALGPRPVRCAPGRSGRAQSSSHAVLAHAARALQPAQRRQLPAVRPAPPPTGAARARRGGGRGAGGRPRTGRGAPGPGRQGALAAPLPPHPPSGRWGQEPPGSRLPPRDRRTDGRTRAPRAPVAPAAPPPPRVAARASEKRQLPTLRLVPVPGGLARCALPSPPGPLARTRALSSVLGRTEGPARRRRAGAGGQVRSLQVVAPPLAEAPRLVP